MRRSHVLATSAVAFAIGVAAHAPTAIAGTYSPTCSTTSSTIIDGPSQTFTIGGSCTSFSWGHGGSTSTSDFTVTLNGNPVTKNTVTSASSGTVVLNYSGPSGVSGGANVTFNPATSSQEEYLINVGIGGGGASSSAASGSAPAPVLQQFAMPATGTCDEAQPEGLNWSGVPNGGWGASWAQWVNSGNGGAVCTRTLVYSTAQSKWVVN